MSSHLDSVDLTDGGTIKWGAVSAVFVGTPLYAMIVGYNRALSLFAGGAQWAVEGASLWLSRYISIPLNGATRAFEQSRIEFAIAVQDFGIFAYLVALAVGIVVMWILIEGVTHVSGWIR